MQSAIAATPKEARAKQRHTLAEAAALEWLDKRAEGAGFRLLKSSGPNDERQISAWLDDYRIVHPPRERGKPAATFGIFDIEGVLRVQQPDVFNAALMKGFGRAKAFGCGLMMVRRRR